jgi:hypothetical protein
MMQVFTKETESYNRSFHSITDTEIQFLSIIFNNTFQYYFCGATAKLGPRLSHWVEVSRSHTHTHTHPEGIL